MAIWFDKFPLDYAGERAAQSMIGHLGIEVIEAGNDYLKARTPVDHRTKQPAGVLHGGASVTLAETLASCTSRRPSMVLLPEIESSSPLLPGGEPGNWRRDAEGAPPQIGRKSSRTGAA